MPALLSADFWSPSATVVVNILAYVVMSVFIWYQYQKYYEKKHAWLFALFLLVSLTGIEFIPNPDGSITVWKGLLHVLLILLTGFLIVGRFDMRILITSFNAMATMLPGIIAGTFLFYVVKNWIFTIGGSVLVHGIVVFIVIRYVDVHYERFAEDENFPWPLVFLIPVFYYTSTYTLMFFPSSFSETPTNAVGLFFVSLLTLISYILVIQILRFQQRSSELKYNNEEYTILIQNMQERINLILEKDKQNVIARHDMRHIIHLIRQLIESGEYDEAMRVMEEHDRKMSETAVHTYCSNVVVNSVLEIVNQWCVDRNVVLTVQADVPKHLMVPDVELGVVLSNLLENAIKAAEKCPVSERHVNFFARTRDDKKIFEITNSFVEAVVYDPKTGLPRTQNGVGHGLGMQSVKMFAERYQALFDCSEENGVFIVRLVL